MQWSVKNNFISECGPLTNQETAECLHVLTPPSADHTQEHARRRAACSVELAALTHTAFDQKKNDLRSVQSVNLGWEYFCLRGISPTALAA